MRAIAILFLSLIIGLFSAGCRQEDQNPDRPASELRAVRFSIRLSDYQNSNTINDAIADGYKVKLSIATVANPKSDRDYVYKDKILTLQRDGLTEYIMFKPGIYYITRCEVLDESDQTIFYSPNKNNVSAAVLADKEYVLPHSFSVESKTTETTSDIQVVKIQATPYISEDSYTAKHEGKNFEFEIEILKIETFTVFCYFDGRPIRDELYLTLIGHKKVAGKTSTRTFYNRLSLKRIIGDGDGVRLPFRKDYNTYDLKVEYKKGGKPYIKNYKSIKERDLENKVFEINFKSELRYVAVKSIEINENQYGSITLPLKRKGGILKTLHYTIKPENATDKRVSWSSDRSEITVDDQGHIRVAKGVFRGDAYITVKTADGGKTDRIRVFLFHMP